MPRAFSDTRAGRAHILLKRLEQGPSFVDPRRKYLTPEEASAAYRLWVASWILPELTDLLPKLKEKE